MVISDDHIPQLNCSTTNSTTSTTNSTTSASNSTTSTNILTTSTNNLTTSNAHLNSFNSQRPPIVKEFNLNGWTFKSVRSSISSATQIETLSHEVGFPLPTMFFGCNLISLSSPTFSLTFDSIRAIKTVAKSSANVPIRIVASNAEFWQQKSQSETVLDYDWTYTPQSFTGTKEGAFTCINSDEEIDFNRLKQQDPILFFDENILFEDELGDNGISLLSVKLRVMNYGFYVLLNHFLRVDQVIFKSISSRYFHPFNQNFILKEIRTCEDSFESIQQKMILIGGSFKDTEAVQQLLPITQKSTEKIIIS